MSGTRRDFARSLAMAGALARVAVPLAAVDILAQTPVLAQTPPVPEPSPPRKALTEVVRAGHSQHLDDAEFLATKDIPTTWGAEPYRNQVFGFDATVVERLTNAGAVLAARLVMVELAAPANEVLLMNAAVNFQLVTDHHVRTPSGFA